MKYKNVYLDLLLWNKLFLYRLLFSLFEYKLLQNFSLVNVLNKKPTLFFLNSFYL